MKKKIDKIYYERKSKICYSTKIIGTKKLLLLLVYNLSKVILKENVVNENNNLALFGKKLEKLNQEFQLSIEKLNIIMSSKNKIEIISNIYNNTHR